MSALLEDEALVLHHDQTEPPCVNDEQRADVFVRLRCCPEAAYLCRPCLDALRALLERESRGGTRRLKCEACGHRWPAGHGFDDIARVEAAR